MNLFKKIYVNDYLVKRYANTYKVSSVSADAMKFLMPDDGFHDLKLNDSKELNVEQFVDNSKKPRFNEFGIQMISMHLYNQLFSASQSKVPDNDAIARCLKELKTYNFDKVQKPVEDIDLDLPALVGNNLEEHFYNIGEQQSKPYKDLISNLLNGHPELPSFWLMEPGWTRYSEGKTERVDYPAENAMVFDVEVCCTAGPLPTLATAVTDKAWYCWVSQDLINSAESVTKLSYTPDDLIPLESNADTSPCDLPDKFIEPRVVIGHNVSYDRARVKEQYWLERTGLKFIDTMSLHVCISGVTSYQKAMLKAGVESDEWAQLSSLNSLDKVYELYCNKKMSKSDRDTFIKGSLKDIKENFQNLVTYCANDVIATFAVLKKIYPMFLERFPHPATLAGMLELQSTFIPVNKNWKRYLEDSQQAYEDLNREAKNVLTRSANAACTLLHDKKYKEDMWLWDQDWSVKGLNLNKTKSKNASAIKSEMSSQPADEMDIVESESDRLKQKFLKQREANDYLPAREPHLPGYPKWYVKLCGKPDNSSWIPGPELISPNMKIVPKLLKLTWKSMPLHCVKGYGWGYLLPISININISDDNFPIEKLTNYFFQECSSSLCDCDFSNKAAINTCLKNNFSKNKKNSKTCKAELGVGLGFYRLPHKDGNDLNVGNPLSQDFINKFSDNELSGATIYAKRLIKINKMLSYWRNNRERIENQFVCWSSNDYLENEEEQCTVGVILPQVVVCGTLTRRAVEPTWMTVSNAISERVGSELRGIVHAPPGYSLVGADVDSQELWIASLLGDAYSVGLHGATPLGWMTLNGQKSDGTDMHSVTAKAVGISRNNAKILNYSRIYGAGQKFAERLFKQFNPSLSDAEASSKAAKMMSLTKGLRMYALKDNCLINGGQQQYTIKGIRELCTYYNLNMNELCASPKWFGGSESAMFNALEEIANSEHPKTPFLGGQLSRALEPVLDSQDKFVTTRVNWVVQSGAVDFLHLMLVSMRWFLGDKARFCLSFHDEVRYLVPEEYKYQAALALHVTHLLTRAFCVTRLGMTDLPLSIAFFSSVDVDVVLRKESYDDNRTPSNPFGLSKGYGVPSGDSLDIHQSIKKANRIIGIKQS